MKQVVIYKSDMFELVSYGNGLAYSLHNLDLCRSVYMQESDADTFYECFQGLYNDRDFHRLWSDYEDVSDPDPE